MNEEQIKVVAGEMTPWTDVDDVTRAGAGGLLWARLLERLAPEGRVAILGPHDRELIAQVARTATSVVVVERSLDDARVLAEDSSVEIVAGSVDRWLEEGGAKDVDWMLALDGFDRWVSYDSAARRWDELWQTFTAAAPAARVLAVVDAHLGPAWTLDARPLRDRTGDREWRPVTSDPTRPRSVEQVQRFAPEHDIFLLNGSPSKPETIRRPGLGLGAVGVGRLVAASRKAGRHWLADPEEMAFELHRSGNGDLHAEAFLIASPGLLDDMLYETAEGSAAASIVEGSDSAACLAAHPSAKERWLSLCEQEDLPAIRDLCRSLAEWYRQTQHHGAFDTIDTAEDTFASVLDTEADDHSGDEAFSRALYLVLLETRDGHHRHPWPEWMFIDGAWESLLEAAAVELSQEQREIARAWAEERHILPQDVRSELARVQDLETSLKFARGHIFGLERTIRFRDEALRAMGAEPPTNAGAAKPGRGVGVGTLVRKALNAGGPKEVLAGMRRVLRRTLKHG